MTNQLPGPINNTPPLPDLTWHDLQKALRDCTTEAEVTAVMERERNGLKRGRWLLRAQGRLNVLRREREMGEFLSGQSEVGG